MPQYRKQGLISEKFWVVSDSGGGYRKKISVLSGGEKIPCTTCHASGAGTQCFDSRWANPPSGYPSKEVLKDAIVNLPAMVIIVSHDQDFLRGLAENILFRECENQRIPWRHRLFSWKNKFGFTRWDFPGSSQKEVNRTEFRFSQHWSVKENKENWIVWNGDFKTRKKTRLRSEWHGRLELYSRHDHYERREWVWRHSKYS